MLEGDCPACRHRYLQDLPSGHGLIYPTTLDIDTGEVFDPADATWFSNRLRPAWEAPDGDPVRFTVTTLEQCTHAILLNCLDPVYGHSVLKLLNAERELKSADGAGCVLVIPSSLSHLVPDGVSEVWEVSEPASRFGRWLLDLEDRIDDELTRFERCALSRAFPHPHPTTYSLDTFVRTPQPERVGDPSVIFSLRDDRTWGRDARRQKQNLDQFRERLLRLLPSAGCAVIGLGSAAPIPATFVDLRTRASEPSVEKRWLSLLAGADAAIGVHGSNMLLASGLARASIELLPRSRYSNIFQATLLDGVDPFAALISHRTLYGNETLSDVSPETLASLTASIVTELARFENLMMGPAAGEGLEHTPAPIPASIEATSSPRPTARRVVANLSRSRVSRRIRHVPMIGRALAEDWLVARRAKAHTTLPLVLADARGGLFELETRTEVEAFIRYGGHFEREALEFSTSLLEKGGIALDVGANIGAFTVAFARAVGPSGRVHAFEPFEAANRRLLRTLELNRLTNVTVNLAAISDSTGWAPLYSYGPGFESWSTLAPRTIEVADRSVTVVAEAAARTLTIDDYCERNEIEKVSLLKIDIEGGELRALRGATRMFDEDRIHAVLVEASDDTLEAFDDRAYRLIDFFEMRRWRTYVVEQGALRPFRVAGKQRALANVIALPRVERLSSS